MVAEIPLYSCPNVNNSNFANKFKTAREFIDSHDAGF